MENNTLQLPIIIAGTSASGKSTVANILNKITGYTIYSIRDHYNNFLVPRYIKKYNLVNQTITRDLHYKIADWIYINGSDAYAKQFLKDVTPSHKAIFESFRLKGDLQYLHKVYPNAVFIHMFAQKEVRINRKVKSYDKLYAQAKDKQDIEKLLDYEWNHFKLQESMDYLKSIGAIMIDTSDFSDDNLELYEIIKKHFILVHK